MEMLIVQFPSVKLSSYLIGKITAGCKNKKGRKFIKKKGRNLEPGTSTIDKFTMIALPIALTPIFGLVQIEAPCYYKESECLPTAKVGVPFSKERAYYTEEGGYWFQA